MSAKTSPYRLKKYDVTQKVIESLANMHSRSILFSIAKKAKAAPQISIENRIPLSTVYKSLKNLENVSLILVEKMILNYDGRKKMKLYKSRISGAEIYFEGTKPSIRLEPSV